MREINLKLLIDENADNGLLRAIQITKVADFAVPLLDGVIIPEKSTYALKPPTIVHILRDINNSLALLFEGKYSVSENYGEQILESIKRLKTCIDKFEDAQ